MRLTTKGRFAVTAMIDLALHENEGPVTLAEISGRQSISLSYLEQLFGKLRRHELVGSVRGPGGGYTLAKPANTVTVAHIVTAVDEAASDLLERQLRSGRLTARGLHRVRRLTRTVADLDGAGDTVDAAHVTEALYLRGSRALLFGEGVR